MTQGGRRRKKVEVEGRRAVAGAEVEVCVVLDGWTLAGATTGQASEWTWEPGGGLRTSRRTHRSVKVLSVAREFTLNRRNRRRVLRGRVGRVHESPLR